MFWQVMFSSDWAPQKGQLSFIRLSLSMHT